MKCIYCQNDLGKLIWPTTGVICYICPHNVDIHYSYDKLVSPVKEDQVSIDLIVFRCQIKERRYEIWLRPPQSTMEVYKLFYQSGYGGWNLRDGNCVLRLNHIPNITPYNATVKLPTLLIFS